MDLCKVAVASILLAWSGSGLAAADGNAVRSRVTIHDLRAPQPSASCSVPGDLGGDLVLVARPTVDGVGERTSMADGSVALHSSADAFLGWGELAAIRDQLAAGGHPVRVDGAGFLQAPWLAEYRYRVCAEAPTQRAVLGDGSSIEGLVTESGTGDPIIVGLARLFDSSGQSLATESLDEKTGGYAFAGLAAGTYYVRTESTGFLDELWDDIACAQQDCVATDGTPIVVSAGTVTADFELGEGGSIAGTVTETGSATPITDGWVKIFDASGSTLGVALLDGSGAYRYGGLAAGTYFARTESTGHLDELWDDLPCPQGDCVATSGTALVVAAGEVTADFVLDAGGEITGSVVSAGTAQPVTIGLVHVFDDSGSSLATASLDEGGTYVLAGLAAGTYFARTESTGLLDELWDDLPCAGGACDVTSGTPIVVSSGAVTADFVLGTGGAIGGSVTVDGSGTPITTGWVRVFDSGGSPVGIDFLDGDGGYAVAGLDAGTYHARTESTGFLDELWDDLPCPQEDCVVTSGTPIVVASSLVTADFALDAGGTITGAVLDQDSFMPVLVGLVRIFDEVGSEVGTAAIGEGGFYTLDGLAAGSYFARTESTGLFDELWQDLPCPAGTCDPTTGTPIVVSGDVATVDFFLTEEAPVLFGDGFESGDTSMWSAVVGGP